MSRILNVILPLCATYIIACDDKEGVDTEGDDTALHESDASLPQSGDWSVLTSGWSNDNCNAEEALTGVALVSFAAVDESSFIMTLFETGEIRIGNSVTCTHTGDDVFACEDLFHDVPIDGMDATVNMVGMPIVTLNSETSAAGQGDLTIDCTGADCSMLAGGMPFTEFPCTTTNNWTAAPE
jgi:hypothetical protein